MLSLNLNAINSSVASYGTQGDTTGRHRRDTSFAANFSSAHHQKIHDRMGQVEAGIIACEQRYNQLPPERVFAHCLQKVASETARKECLDTTEINLAECLATAERTALLVSEQHPPHDWTYFENDPKEVRQQNRKEYKHNKASEDSDGINTFKQIRSEQETFLRQQIPQPYGNSTEEIKASLGSNALNAWNEKSHGWQRREARERLGLLRTSFQLTPAKMTGPAHTKVRKSLARLLHVAEGSGPSQQYSDENLKNAYDQLLKESNRG